MAQLTHETNNPGLNPGEGTPNTAQTEKPWSAAAPPQEQPPPESTAADLKDIEDDDIKDETEEDAELDIPQRALS